MLEQALKVVEAARSMQLKYKGGKTTTDLDIKSLAFALDGLRKSIEEFDAATGYVAGDFSAKMRPDFATPEQIADEGYIEDLNLKNPTPEMRIALQEDIEHDLEMKDELTEENTLKHTQETRKKTLETEIPKPVLAAAVLSQLGKRGRRNRENGMNSVDLGDGVFYDGDESATDLLMAMDAINDKLTYAVRKIGWSPRLRRMAEALRKAQEHMTLEIKGEHGYVRIPAHQWGPLSVAIAETALDQDLTVALPQPKPRLEHDYELEQQRKNAPRPPSHM